MTKFGELVRTLASGSVDFIIVGGVAAAAHGSARATQDLDVVYRRGIDNLAALAAALAPLDPCLRGAPPGLPFHLDVATLRAGLNFTLTTNLGWLDLLGEIAGGGGYEDLLPHSIEVEAFGVTCRVLDVDALIRAKRAAGRPKDLEVIAELESLRQRRAARA
ncbi:MAG: hypothetical protein U0Q16_22845 [Bryobacteraceae bacterium]